MCGNQISEASDANLNVNVNLEGINYSLNQKDKTAKILSSLSTKSKIIIPRSIKFRLNEYEIISITELGFSFSKNLNKILFASDSKLRIIDKNTFSWTSIKSISIPRHVTQINENAFYRCNNLMNFEIPSNSELNVIEGYAFHGTQISSLLIPSNLFLLKKGWCSLTNKLNEIEVDMTNQRYSCLNEQYLIGKSDLFNRYYDILSFAVRNIVDVRIPASIKVIESYAFEGCRYIQHFEIPPNSELQTIDEFAFKNSSISRIFIPAKLVDLKKDWNRGLSDLTQIEVDPENPRYSCIEKKFLIGKSDLSSNDYDVLILSVRDVVEARIPINIKIIESYSFEYCQKLRKFEIPSDSKLQTIDAYAFHVSSIPNIFFPAGLVNLNKNWCIGICGLNNIEVDPKNPRYLCIDGKILIGKSYLSNDDYDILFFGARNIVEARIPNCIKAIASYAFENCMKLSRIEFQQNSELRAINTEVFFNSPISSFAIPAHVTSIDENSFFFCQELRIIEIDENTEMRRIHAKRFNQNTIIMIPVQKLKSIK